MPTIDMVCTSCGGTGLYVGFAEPKGTAAVCASCSGTGCRVLRYTPFKKRRPRRGIRKVYFAWGRGTPVTYREFLRGKRPIDDAD